jgi:hypothetical protein
MGRRCVNFNQILPKTPTHCTSLERLAHFKQLKLPKVFSCRFPPAADDGIVEASPAGLASNDPVTSI